MKNCSLLGAIETELVFPTSLEGVFLFGLRSLYESMPLCCYGDSAYFFYG
jgi:hypothetical protein